MNESSVFRFFSRFALMLLVCGPAFFTALAQTDDDEPIRIDSTIVVLNATVTDAKGKFVGGLKRGQFKVFEDGKEQTIDTFTAEEVSFAAVLLIDTSGSMTVRDSNFVYERVRVARAAAISFLDYLRPDDLVAVYRFDSKVEEVREFSSSRDAPQSIFDLKADGMTSLHDAIYKASEELAKRPEKRKAIIVLSDGGDTQSRYSADKALKKAIDSAATIYAIDISTMAERTRMQNARVLKNFADQSGGRFISAQNGQALRETFKNLAEELRSQYTITYQPTNAAKDGKWRAVETRIDRPELNLRARKGYYAPK